MKPAHRPALPLSLAALALAAQALAGLGCAHAPAAPAADRAAAPARVMVTGSRMPRTVDADHPVPVTDAPVRVYTREQLLRTGRPDLRAALGELDPAAK